MPVIINVQCRATITIIIQGLYGRYAFSFEILLATYRVLTSIVMPKGVVNMESTPIFNTVISKRKKGPHRSFNLALKGKET